MKNDSQIIKQNQFTEFLIYTTPDKKVKVEIFLHNKNIWLTQVRIAELFGVNRPAITKHLKNIFETGELNKKSVSSILEHAAKDGKKYKTLFYSLDFPPATPKNIVDRRCKMLYSRQDSYDYTSDNYKKICLAYS